MYFVRHAIIDLIIGMIYLTYFRLQNHFRQGSFEILFAHCDFYEFTFLISKNCHILSSTDCILQSPNSTVWYFSRLLFRLYSLWLQLMFTQVEIFLENLYFPKL